MGSEGGGDVVAMFYHVGIWEFLFSKYRELIFFLVPQT